MATDATLPVAATWLGGVSLERLDRRFGVDRVDHALQGARSYAVLPHFEEGARLVAALHDAERRLKVGVRWLNGAELEIACTCSSGRSFVCPHGLALLADVAVHPGLDACIVGERGHVETWASGLALARRTAYEVRTLDQRLAHWLPPSRFDDDLEVGVEIARLPPLGAAEAPSAVLLRHRRRGTRKLLRPREVVDARLPPAHRRLVELTTPSNLHKDALVATRAQASLLLHLLAERTHVFTRAFGERLRFSKALACPCIERDGDRLVARWKTIEGTPIGSADDTLLFAGPYPYIASETDETLYAVSPDVDLDIAAGFALVPSLPLTPETSPRIGRALLVRGRGMGVTLPTRAALGLPPLEAPTFRLRLDGTPLSVEATLSAVYGGTSFPIEAEPSALGADGGDGGDRRDVDAEMRALSRLVDAGFVVEAGEGIRAVEDRAVDLWRSGLERLRSSTDPTFAIEVSENIARTRVGPPAEVRVNVASRSGWLDTELVFTSGAIRVELARVRAALLESRRWIVLDDGTLSHIGDHVARLVEDVGSFPADAQAGTVRIPLRLIGRVAAWVDRFDGLASAEVNALRDRVVARAARAAPQLPTDLNATLRPYQLQGVAWLEVLRDLGSGGVLADDMGLGKTLMTLAFLARWKQDHARKASLVVCPTSLVGNWLREAERFTPGMRVLVLHGTPESRRSEAIVDADLVITTYGLLRRDIDALAEHEFRAVVLDEAQNVKNPMSATFRAAERLDAEMVLALTGTPVENRLTELWSLLDLTVPGLLGDADQFRERFEVPMELRPDGDVAADLRAVVRPFVLRRTKRDVLPELPEKTEIERGCVLSFRERRSYDALAMAVRESVKKDHGGAPRARMSVLTGILRLRQMACDPRLIEPEREGEPMPPRSAKREAFLDVVRELVREGRRALVFSQFVELLHLWRRDLDQERVAYEYLDGSSTDRDRIVERFQTGVAPLFLISLKAGGAGLNLTAADTVVHCDPWWNPAVEEQATDRAHRIGQARAVNVIRLVALGTIEEKVGLLKEKKRELAASVLGHDANDAPDAPDAGRDGLAALSAADLDVLLGNVVAPASDADVEALDLADESPSDPVRPRWVPALEIDSLRELARTVIGSGFPRKEFSRRVGYPAARLALLLFGHRVPIAVDVAERMRVLASERLPSAVVARFAL